MDDYLMAKLPKGEGPTIHLRDHWTEAEIEGIVEKIARLGGELDVISARARGAHDAQDIQLVREAITFALLRMHDILLPICGMLALWPLRRACDVFGEAQKGKHHWLVTFDDDEPHLPQRAPYREVLKTQAAAAFHYFESLTDELGMKSSEVADCIAEAMAEGRFRVRPHRHNRVTGRAVREWRDLILGRRPRRNQAPPYVQKTFTNLARLYADSRPEATPIGDYFAQILASITAKCQENTELFPDDQQIRKK